jgi:tetratricopeptide (TPR) repeat protein
MKNAMVTLLWLFFGSQPIQGAEDISQREAVRKGIELIYNLDYAEAQKIFDQIKKDDPESPVGYGMTALNAFNQVLFASRNLAIYEYGIPAPIGRSVPASLLDTPEQKHFDDANGILQEFCEKLLEKNPEDALALYFNGMSYESLAILSMTHDRKIMRTKGYAKRAADLHKKVLELDPSLIDAKASSAVLEYVIGSLNFVLRIGARLFGLKGDREGAIEKLLEVGEKGIYRSTDAKVALAYLQAWKGDVQVSISILGDLRKNHPRSFLYDIGLATAYMGAAKDAKSAIGIYQELLDNISSKAPGVYPGEIHFRIANCYVQLRDYSLALEQFQKALDAKRGDAETEPLVYYNMARIYEERGEKKLARDCYQRVADYSGPTVLIEDEIKRARKKIQ